MSDTGPSGIDFEKAEYADGAAPVVACIVCKEPIGSTYFDVNGQMVCERCRLQIDSELKTAGSGLQGVALGAAAAVVGGAVWAVVTSMTGYAIGLIAVGVGWLVGKAVAKGSTERATVPARVAGVVFTYLAIVAQYVPDILEYTGGEGANAYVSALVLAVQMPILRGLEGFMGLLILGFALWEAWSRSTPRQLVITGPFQLSSRPPASTDVDG